MNRNVMMLNTLNKEFIMWIINTYKMYKSPKGHTLFFIISTFFFFARNLCNIFLTICKPFNQHLPNIMHTSTLAENDHIFRYLFNDKDVVFFSSHLKSGTKENLLCIIKINLYKSQTSLHPVKHTRCSACSC